jgi:hypothetical protein
MQEGVSRRRFIGYLLAGPTLIAAADLGGPRRADAAVPTVQPVDEYDLSDLLTDAATPTSNLITVVVNHDGMVSFALPRAEVGRGITTAGGIGEFGVAATMAATACAYWRATGTFPMQFPINHDQPLGFTPYPTVPPLPQSPTNGLTYAQ